MATIQIETLTAQTYAERKAELQRHRTAAVSDHDRAALSFELGKIGSDDLAAAKQGVDETDARLTGLDAAWGHAQRLAAEQDAREDLKARKAAAAEVRKLVKARAKALKAIEQTLLQLKPHVTAYDEASANIRRVVSPYGASLGRLGMIDLSRSLVERHAEGALVRGILFGEGAWGIGARDDWFAYRERGVDHFLDRTGSSIERTAAEALVLEDDD